MPQLRGNTPSAIEDYAHEIPCSNLTRIGVVTIFYFSVSKLCSHSFVH
jgi:hypothetical protein